MALLGPHPLAVLLCKCSDQAAEPQTRAFFESYFGRIDWRRWAGAFRIVEPGVRSSAPGGGIAVVSRQPDHLDVFWAGDDGAIWSTWWNANLNGGRWNAAFPITGPDVAPPGASVAAVSRRPDHLDVFWADMGGAIGTQWWSGSAANGGWSAHQAFRVTGPGVVPPGGAVAVVSRQPDQLDVFWADTGGAIGTQWWNGVLANGQWNQHGAFRITGVNVVPPGGGVAVVSRRPDHLDVFWADNGGAIGTQWWNGQAPNGGWNQHAAFRITDAGIVPPGASVAAVTRQPDHLDVFWIDNSGAVASQWWNGAAQNGNWDRHPAFRLSAPKTAPAGGRVTAAARKADHLDVFWADFGGAVGSAWWHAGSNNGQWNAPFRVTGTSVVPPGGHVATLARLAEQLDVFWLDTVRGLSSSFWPAPSEWGLAKYWFDQSHGRFDIDGTKVFGWFTMTETTAQFLAKTRAQKIDACVAAATAAGVNLAGFFTVVGIPNVTSDSGSDGTRAILDPLAWTLGWAAHETGHCLKLDHSFDDAPASCSPANDGRAGAYADGWDIMSFACFGGDTPMFANADTFGASGPGLNAHYRDKLGWIPADRIQEIAQPFHGAVTVAGLDTPSANAPLLVKLFPTGDRNRYYTLEFRRPLGWDRGIPGDAVLIHEVRDGLPFLIRASGGPERRPGHHLDAFWCGGAGAIESSWWNARDSSAGWNTPFGITGTNTAPPSGQVAAVSRRPNNLDVFWADTGGAIGTQWWSSDGTNGQWNQHAAFRVTPPNMAPPGAPVAAVSRRPDHLDVFWADTGGAIATQWWNGVMQGGAWNEHGPFRITNPGIVPPGAGVAVVSRLPDHLDVFWADSAGAIASHWWDGLATNGQWNAHPSFRLTGVGATRPGGAVAAVSRLPDHLDVFWIGTDGAIWTAWWNAGVNGGRWNAPFPITAANVAPAGGHLAVVSRRPDHLDVFWSDAAGAIGSHWWNGTMAGGAWNAHPPFRVTNPGSVAPGAAVAAVSRNPDHLDVLWVNARRAIEAQYWDGQEPAGAWHRHGPVEITPAGAVSADAGVAVAARYPDRFIRPDHQLTLQVQRFDLASSTAVVDIAFG